MIAIGNNITYTAALGGTFVKFKTVPTPVRNFTYASNGNDITGSLTPASGSQTYGSDGAVLTAGSSQKRKNTQKAVE